MEIVEIVTSLFLDTKSKLYLTRLHLLPQPVGNETSGATFMFGTPRNPFGTPKSNLLKRIRLYIYLLICAPKRLTARLPESSEPQKPCYVSIEARRIQKFGTPIIISQKAYCEPVCAKSAVFGTPKALRTLHHQTDF